LFIFGISLYPNLKIKKQNSMKKLKLLLTFTSLLSAWQGSAQSTIPQRDLWAIGTNVVKFNQTTGALQAGSIGTLPINLFTTQNNFQPNPANQTINNAYHDEKVSYYFILQIVRYMTGRADLLDH
jgi:hypothetical protein